MTKIFICVAVLFLATVGFNSAVAQSNFPLRCRGPLNYAVGTGEVVFFTKNSARAGEGGISLQPGTCAWNDRAMANSDPSKIYVQPETSTKVYPAFTAFAACAGNSRCVVEFLAHNANTPGDPHFQVENTYLRVYYPDFP